jgi:hypothetical protein
MGAIRLVDCSTQTCHICFPYCYVQRIASSLSGLLLKKKDQCKPGGVNNNVHILEIAFVLLSLVHPLWFVIEDVAVFHVSVLVLDRGLIIIESSLLKLSDTERDS